MISWPTLRRLSRESPPRRSGPWHRDETSGANAIARLEDDGGRVYGDSKLPSRPLSTDGHIILPYHPRFL